jgi:3D (Asp-Asp-Asp) domain-containing protein
LTRSAALRVAASLCLLAACEAEVPTFDDAVSEPTYAGVVVVSDAQATNSGPALIPVEISAYCLTGRTARGGWARPGIVAADKSVFPLGTYIELWVGDHYLGRFLVDDSGRDIRGGRIDLWMADCSRANTFGRRSGAAATSPPR